MMAQHGGESKNLKNSLFSHLYKTTKHSSHWYAINTIPASIIFRRNYSSLPGVVKILKKIDAGIAILSRLISSIFACGRALRRGQNYMYVF